MNFRVDAAFHFVLIVLGLEIKVHDEDGTIDYLRNIILTESMTV